MATRNAANRIGYGLRDPAALSPPRPSEIAPVQGQAVQAITLVAVLGMAAQWIAWRLRIPAIVLLTAVGLALGPGLGWLQPSADFGELLEPFVSFAVAFILFEGGLRLKLHDLEEAGRSVRRLCTVGLLLSWALGTAAAIWVGGLSPAVGVIFGAILVVTGPTVIMPLLRQARLEKRLASLFKWEGIVNDPLAALCVVLSYEVIVAGSGAGSGAGSEHGGAGVGGIAAQLGLALLAGGGLGALGGWLLSWAFRHGHVPEFQKAPALVAAVFGSFALANAIHDEAGLLAVTVMGAVIGNSGLASIAELTRFKDSLSTVLVSGVFLLVSADMDTATLATLDMRAVALLLCVLFVVRPAAILLSTIGVGLQRNERLLLAWIAPRGVVAAAVAGVIGPRLVAAGYPDGALLVPLVFATILVTVVLHGFSLPVLARRLGLSAGTAQGVLLVGATRWSTALAEVLQQLGVPVVVSDTAWTRLSRTRLAGVTSHFGEVLSESGEASLPLNEIDVVIALTSNDSYNSLVCVHYGPEIGRDRVYQLAAADVGAEHPRGVTVTARGRVLISDNADYETLHRHAWNDWTFRSTKLTDEYDLDAWRRDATPGAELVLCVRANGTLAVHGPRFPLEAASGDTVVSFTPPPENGTRTPPEPRTDDRKNTEEV